MSDPAEQRSAADGLRLADAIRDVKNGAADREDVVVELREAQRTRLDLLAAELGSVFAEVPPEAGFDFAISSGTQPRLWIDAVSFVTMGRDRRTYRFVKDTRLGRVVLAESLEIKPVADQVTRYIAERIVERERIMDGDVEPILRDRDASGADGEPAKAKPSRWRAFLSGVLLVLAGAVVGLIGASAVLWDKLPALGIKF